jgi:hypothetical protein
MTYPAPLPSMGSLFAPAVAPILLGGGDAAPFPWMSSLFAPPAAAGVADVAIAASRPRNRWLIRRGPLPDAMYTIDIEKTPWEERTYEFDLAALLAADESLASVDGVSVDQVGPSTVAATGAVIVADSKVRARLSGGALPAVGPWSDHVVHVRAITSLTHKVEGVFRLRVLGAPTS